MGLIVDCLIELRVKDHLGDPFSITQVYKNNTAMVSTAQYPAHEHHFFAHVFGGQLRTVVGSF